MLPGSLSHGKEDGGAAAQDRGDLGQLQKAQSAAQPVVVRTLAVVLIVCAVAFLAWGVFKEATRNQDLVDAVTPFVLGLGLFAAGFVVLLFGLFLP